MREARLLFGAMLAGLVLYAGVAWYFATRHLVGGFGPLTPTLRSVLILLVGAGCFVGLRTCRTAYNPPTSAGSEAARAFVRSRSILGWAIIDGLGFAGITAGLAFADPGLVLMLAGLAVGAFFLARPDLDRAEAAAGNAP